MPPTAIIHATSQSYKRNLFRKGLLICGALSSVFYAVVNILVPFQYEGYNAASQTVSELSAIGAPTRSLWMTLIMIYSLLMLAFGLGVWMSADKNHYLRISGILIIINVLIGLFWPPMHQREALAAGEGSLTDKLHIAFTIVTILFMLLIMGFGTTAFGKRILWFSIITVVFLMIFGTMTALDSPRMEANLPTPWIGVWERISIVLIWSG